MFTDEILVQIERNSGSEEAAAHYTSERTVCDTKNTQSAQLPRSPLTSLQPNGGTGATTADPTEQAAMDKEEGQVMKPKRTASEAGVDMSAKSGRHGRAEQSMN